MHLKGTSKNSGFVIDETTSHKTSPQAVSRWLSAKPESIFCRLDTACRCDNFKCPKPDKPEPKAFGRSVPARMDTIACRALLGGSSCGKFLSRFDIIWLVRD